MPRDADPRCLVRIDDEALVEFGKFALFLERPNPELHDPYQLPLDWNPTLEPIMATGAGGAVFLSAAIDHYAAVRMEVWTAEPAPDVQHWDQTEAGVIPVDKRSLFRIRTEGHGWTPALIELHESHHLRAHVRGRQDAAARGEAEFFHGIECWLLQLWPTERA